MDRMVFINLPVSDLKKSTDFYKGLGFTQNPDFSSPDASYMTISGTIAVMLLTEEYFGKFLRNGTPHLGSDAKEILVALSAESNEEVDRFLANAQSGGGTAYRPTEEEMPGMYGGAMADPDGHVWEIMYMSPEALQGAAGENTAATDTGAGI
ncbi:VOC family protein [Arthrobacter sp. NPDC089319]|uniref:VOC family protein n=1 Tax=Arthrobacter sp. NPDC089319 TaxID=3155915 RepID=UPI0034216873